MAREHKGIFNINDSSHKDSSCVQKIPNNWSCHVLVTISVSGLKTFRCHAQTVISVTYEVFRQKLCHCIINVGGCCPVGTLDVCKNFHSNPSNQSHGVTDTGAWFWFMSHKTTWPNDELFIETGINLDSRPRREKGSQKNKQKQNDMNDFLVVGDEFCSLFN